MKISVYTDEQCESEYIKLTVSIFFHHQPHKHKFYSFLEKESLQTHTHRESEGERETASNV